MRSAQAKGEGTGRLTEAVVAVLAPLCCVGLPLLVVAAASIGVAAVLGGLLAAAAVAAAVLLLLRGRRGAARRGGIFAPARAGQSCDATPVARRRDA